MSSLKTILHHAGFVAIGAIAAAAIGSPFVLAGIIFICLGAGLTYLLAPDEENTPAKEQEPP